MTDRDDIIAEIHKPVSAPTSMVSRWEAFLNEAERKGSIIRAKREKSNLAEALLRLSPPPGSPDWKSILDETRDDRF